MGVIGDDTILEYFNSYVIDGQDNKEIKGTPDEIFNILKEKLKYKKYKEKDIELIEKAYKFADEYHKGQKRASGEPFIIHPLNVAIILTDYGMDADTISAGLLHDVLEDTDATSSKLTEIFGEKITGLVEGVTKTSEIKTKNPNLSGLEIVRLFFKAVNHPNILIIKLADRLHNIRTLQYIRKPEKRRRIAEETLSIYAKLAGRLGIEAMKRELEDRAFYFLAPKEWKLIRDIYYEKAKKYEKDLELAKTILSKRLKEEGISAKIQSRIKHLYSIYRKMKEQNRDINDIYDYLGIRIITNNVKDCYFALGIVHSLWEPIQGRLKDYIAIPKTNGYQSLHTTVIGPKSIIFEVQVRTVEMHKTAEYGFAAHWRYKEKMSNKKEVVEWLKVLREEIDTEYTEEETVNKDLDKFFETEAISVFTPKGSLIELPKNATVLDFAYKVHTDLGYRCVGAEVNGVFYSVDRELCDGDVVYIKISPYARPNPNHLKIVKTQKAAKHIKAYLNKLTAKRENIEEEAPIISSVLKEVKTTNFPIKIEIRDFGVRKIDVANCLDTQEKPPKYILGYASYGVYTFHIGDCDILKFYMKSFPKKIEVFSYDNEKKLYSLKTYKFSMSIKGYDRSGLLADISGKISNLGINMEYVNTELKKEKVVFYIKGSAKNPYQLLCLRRALKRLVDIEAVSIYILRK